LNAGEKYIMTREFVYIAQFEKQREHLGLTEKDIEDKEGQVIWTAYLNL